MNRGETATYRGKQVALFPMYQCNCSQLWGPGTYSHVYGHCTDWAMPMGTPIYAPCDCHLIYSDGASVGNTRCFTSDSDVYTPSGLKYITFLFTHDNNPPLKTSYKQGEIIYHSGKAGQATGPHVHLDASPIKDDYLVNPGVSDQSWYLSKDVSPVDIFYLTGSEQIINMRGLNFETWQGSPVVQGQFKWWMAKLLLDKKKGVR